MSHCPGCGGHLGASHHGYGHILGCGFDDRDWNPSHPDCTEPHGEWGLEEQQGILLDVLKSFKGKSGPTAKAPDAKALAIALQAVLQKRYPPTTGPPP
ncbi:MAG TPA: hypothetical protein VIL45_01570 [Thermoplasmata archaeon]